MKHFITLICFCFMATFVSSCAVRGGLNEAYDVSKYSAPSGTGLVAKSGKSSKSQASASASVTNKNSTSRTGFYVGVVFAGINLLDKFRVQPEINFLAIKDNLNQFHAPILAKYEVIDRLNVAAGPNFGYLLDAPNGIKSFNFGVDVGVSYDITENIMVSARYNKGLSNLQENAFGDSSIKLNNVQIGLGYKFN